MAGAEVDIIGRQDREPHPPASCTWPQAAALAHMGTGGAVPQVCNLAQVLREVVLVLSLRRQLQVPAEGVQPHRVGSAVGEWHRVDKVPSQSCH